MLHDTKADYFRKEMYDKIEKVLSKNQHKYSRMEFARVMGAWAVDHYFHNAFSWEALTEANSVMKKPVLKKYPIGNKIRMSHEVKESAKLFGASFVGITRIDPKWVYSKNRNGKTISIPEDFRVAIVMALVMDPVAICTSPAFTACTETALGYSRMALCIGCMAEFIRSLGYKAIPMGNDTALSIPLAIDAGLGELGRNGLLITPQYGPCVRLCKVFTDMPLKADIMIKFGVTEYCKSCKKCAEACVANAIQTSREPSYETVCPSNNQGVLRWAVNHDECYKFWIENGGECSNCIAACPYVPIYAKSKQIE
jgi:hypothetical protein